MMLKLHAKLGAAALLGLLVAGMLYSATPVPDDDGDPSPDEHALKELHLWRTGLAGDDASETTAKADEATSQDKPSVPTPAAFLNGLESQIGACRQDMAGIARWQADQPEPTGHTEELVFESRACAVERRNLRKLREHLVELRERTSNWETVQEAERDARKRRLDQIIRWLKVQETRDQAVAELRSWLDEVRTSIRAHAAEPPPTNTQKPRLEAIVKQIGELLAKKVEASDRDEEPGGKAHAETLVHTAGLFRGEREKRQELQKGIEQILEQLDAWLRDEKAPPVEDGRRLERILHLVADQPPPPAVAAKPQAIDASTPENPESFEYFQLPKEQTLREVSALATVYGDPDRWNRLLEANRETVSSPDTRLPVGTLLVVPRTLPEKTSTN